MSNALEALMGLTDDQVAAYIADPETEGHIVIGPDRFITVPESLKRIAVQHDHNIETVTFDCPRYWDDRDLSEMKIYISYKLADGTLDSHIGENVVVDDDVIHFDWTIKDAVTKVPGAITFLICAKKTDSEGNLENHWNTELCSDLTVSAGMECVETAAEAHPDLITQLLERMDIVEQINVQADEMRTLHNETLTSSEEAEAAKNAAIEAKTKVEESAEDIRNLYSNAIVGTASGEAIRVDDVSPIEHTVKVKPRSKNLAIRTSNKTSVVVDGVTFTVNDDGTITANGTATSTAYYRMQIGTGYTSQIPIEKGRYTISMAPAPGCRVSLGLRENETVERTLYYSTDTNTISFDVTTDTSRFDMILCVDTGYTVENAVFKPQLEIGDTATEFTPYVDPSTVTVTACGKNMFDSSKLLNVPGWIEENGVYSGYAFPVHDKYNHIINSPLVTGFKPNTRYVMTCKAYVEIQNGAEEQTGLVLQFKHSDGSLSSMYIKHPSETEYKIVSTPGKTVIGAFATYGSSIITHIRDIQVEEGVDPTAYEPYTGSTDLTSVSPTMTVMSNKAGVILDVEYNKDINCVFDEINSLLELLLNGGA